MEILFPLVGLPQVSRKAFGTLDIFIPQRNTPQKDANWPKTGFAADQFQVSEFYEVKDPNTDPLKS